MGFNIEDDLLMDDTRFQDGLDVLKADDMREQTLTTIESKHRDEILDLYEKVKERAEVRGFFHLVLSAYKFPLDSSYGRVDKDTRKRAFLLKEGVPSRFTLDYFRDLGYRVVYKESIRTDYEDGSLSEYMFCKLCLRWDKPSEQEDIVI